MATAAAGSRLRITTHSNVELKCCVRSRNLKKPRKRIVSAKEFYGKLPYNRHITLDLFKCPLGHRRPFELFDILSAFLLFVSLVRSDAAYRSDHGNKRFHNAIPDVRNAGYLITKLITSAYVHACASKRVHL